MEAVRRKTWRRVEMGLKVLSYSLKPVRRCREQKQLSWVTCKGLDRVS